MGYEVEYSQYRCTPVFMHYYTHIPHCLWCSMDYHDNSTCNWSLYSENHSAITSHTSQIFGEHQFLNLTEDDAFIAVEVNIKIHRMLPLINKDLVYAPTGTTYRIIPQLYIHTMVLASLYYYDITIEWHDRSLLVRINTTVQYSNYSIGCHLTLRQCNYHP